VSPDRPSLPKAAALGFRLDLPKAPIAMLDCQQLGRVVAQDV
jgi:hypothetical protein